MNHQDHHQLQPFSKAIQRTTIKPQTLLLLAFLATTSSSSSSAFISSSKALHHHHHHLHQPHSPIIRPPFPFFPRPSTSSIIKMMNHRNGDAADSRRRRRPIPEGAPAALIGGRRCDSSALPFTPSSSSSIQTLFAASSTPSESDSISPLSSQSILIVGAGAVGCVYGGRLLEQGHDVTFLMRRDLAAVREKGLRITSPDGDMYFPQPSTVGSTSEYTTLRNGKPADWLILALKSTSFKDIPTLLENGVVGPETRVLLLMNGYGLEKDLSQWIDGQRIFGGMAFVCANRGPPQSGQVAHLKYGKLVLGHYRDDPEELALIERLWLGTKVEIETAPSLLKARWMKLCWNVPYNGLGVFLDGISVDPIVQPPEFSRDGLHGHARRGVSVDHIVQSPEFRELASRVMLDVIKAANVELGLASMNDATTARKAFASEREETPSSSVSISAGLHPPPTKIDREFHDLMFALTDVMGAYLSSTVLDLRASLPMETEYMFLKPLARAQELGVDVPYMEFVCKTVEGIRRMRGL